MRRFVVGLILGLLAAAYVATGQVVPGNLSVLTDQHAFVVAHVSSVTHVVLAGTSAGSLPISTIAHVTSVTHIFGRAMLVGRDGTYVSVTAGELNVTCTGCSAASVVAVSHVASVVHIAVSGSGTPTQSLSVRCVNTAGTAFESCSGTSTLETIAHVSGALHIAGTIRGAAFHIQGLGTPGASHGGVLSIQGIGGGNAVAVSQSGTWTVQPGNTVNTTAWLVNVGHISGAVHLAGGVVDNANSALRVTNVTHVTVMGTISHISQQLHVAGVGISPQFTMFRVNCGSTAATAISVGTTRKRVILQNVGTLPIYIGGGHVTVTTSNAFTLHAVSAAQNAATTSRLELTDFQGRVDCISEGPGQTLEVLQVIGGR